MLAKGKEPRLHHGIKTIQFDDMNWDKDYRQNRTHSQSKLAQMMFAYALQDRTAAKGSWPGVMCATEDGLEQRALFGPTGRMEFVGPAGKGTLHPHAHDKPVMVRLWEVSEAAAGITSSL